MRLNVFSWNIHATRGASETRVAKLVHAVEATGPDLVLLQEVAAHRLPERLAKRLAQIGLPHIACSADPASVQKRYGNLIACRWPLEVINAKALKSIPWPQSIAAATVTCGDRSVDVLSVHIPNGSNNGWRKVETLEGLAVYLQNADDKPRIVGGDFNEPREFRANGQVVTFGQKVKRDGTLTTSLTKWDNTGVVHPRYRWDHAVRAVLAGPSSHGLRHAYFDQHPFHSETTHIVRGTSRCFDHLMVSRHFHVVDAGYAHDLRTKKLSDHSAVWGRLDLR
jgi:exodeoxyribonuclease-3